jgi:mRNA-degrading endonuclease RelE of RelBE toxin-antitoxin system
MALLFDEDALSDVPPDDLRRIIQKTEWLWTNRKAVTHYPLSQNLSGFYKRRVGKYRIIYTYDSNPDELVIRLVGTRDDIYKKGH